MIAAVAVEAVVVVASALADTCLSTLTELGRTIDSDRLDRMLMSEATRARPSDDGAETEGSLQSGDQSRLDYSLVVLRDQSDPLDYL